MFIIIFFEVIISNTWYLSNNEIETGKVIIREGGGGLGWCVRTTTSVGQDYFGACVVG